MKPILLKIEGLNSFREEQIIDFKKLMEKGFFGIFGNTGSGKSTILDAVTLALYGDIPRNSTEFINSYSKEAKIHFEFELKFNGKSITYAVQRCYKAKKDGGYTCRVAKFYEKESGNILAEGATNVNRKSEELIGLKADDFTRTVMLPQGKFSEFLTLKSKDRNDMLERILHLEDYGTNLNKKIAVSRIELAAQIKDTEKELEFYKEDTEENLQKLQEIYELAEKETAKNLQEKNILDKKNKENYDIWNLQEERKKYILKQEKLLEQAEEIEFQKNKLELARKAQIIKPYLDTLDDTKKKFDISEKLFEEKKSESEKVKEEENLKNSKYEVLRDKKENKIPELLKLETNLEQAVQIKEKVKVLQIERIELQKQYKLKNTELKELEKNEKENEDKIESQKIELENIARTKNEIKISSDYKVMINSVVQLCKEYNLFLENSQKIEKKLNKNFEYLTNNSNDKKILQKDLEKLNIKIEKIDEKIIELEKNNPEKEESLLEIQNKYNEKKYQKKLESFKIQFNVENIKEGEPCPLCGSIHHPNMKENEEMKKNSIIDNLELEIKKLSDKIEFVKKSVKLWENQKVELEEELVQKKENRTKIENEIIKISENEKQFLNNKVEFEKELKEYLDKLKDLDREIQQYKQNLGVEDFIQEQNRIVLCEKKYSELEEREVLLRTEISKVQEIKESIATKKSVFVIEINDIKNKGVEKKNTIENYEKDIEQLVGDSNIDIENLLVNVKQEISNINNNVEKLFNELQKIVLLKQKIEKEYIEAKGNMETYSRLVSEQRENLKAEIFKNDFRDEEEVRKSLISTDEVEKIQNHIKVYEDELKSLKANITSVELKLDGRNIELVKLRETEQALGEITDRLENLKNEIAVTKEKISNVEENIKKVKDITARKENLVKKYGLIEIISNMTKGNKFIKFVSKKQMEYLTIEATKYLKMITNGRYAIELDDNDDFIMRDDFNGGIKRKPSTLSGGEVFNTSLALALALSSQIQLKNKAPLEFFFLDEGFGSLDSDLLETVINTLEKLRHDRINIGVISHVEALKNRIPSKLLVKAADGVKGSRVEMDI